MKRFKEFVVVLVSASFVAALSACGGGSSSSGGGIREAATAYTGTYWGFATATVSIPGVTPETVTGSIVVVINPDGTVILDPSLPFAGSGTITGNMVTAAYPGASFSMPGFICAGPVLASATIVGIMMSGTIGPSTIQCNGIPVTIQGTFTTEKISAAYLPTPAPAPGAGAGNRRADQRSKFFDDARQVLQQMLDGY